MRIAFLPDYYLPHVGGMQVWTRELAVRLAERGHDVSVFTYRIPYGEDGGSEVLSVRRVGWPPVREPHVYLPLMLSRLTGLPAPLLRERFDVYLPTMASPS